MFPLRNARAEFAFLEMLAVCLLQERSLLKITLRCFASDLVESFFTIDEVVCDYRLPLVHDVEDFTFVSVKIHLPFFHLFLELV